MLRPTFHHRPLPIRRHRSLPYLQPLRAWAQKCRPTYHQRVLLSRYRSPFRRKFQASTRHLDQTLPLWSRRMFLRCFRLVLPLLVWSPRSRHNFRRFKSFSAQIDLQLFLQMPHQRHLLTRFSLQHRHNCQAFGNLLDLMRRPSYLRMHLLQFPRTHHHRSHRERHQPALRWFQQSSRNLVRMARLWCHRTDRRSFTSLFLMSRLPHRHSLRVGQYQHHPHHPQTIRLLCQFNGKPQSRS
jgi:hypothetical protein